MSSIYLNHCGVGKRSQTPKSVTGVENEVGTPRQLRYVPISAAAHMRSYNIISDDTTK